MSLIDENVDDWQARVARFRRFSVLLGQNGAAAPLRALAQEIERHLLKRYELRAQHDELARLRDVMIAEIDVVLACACSSRLRRVGGFSAADLREEAQLCREEADAALDAATRRAFARRALDLEMLGEELARENGD